MESLFPLLSGLVTFFVLVAFLLILFLRRLSRKALTQAMENWESEGVILSERVSNFFGRESAGYAQVRGNCAFLLTEAGLRHLMWSPRRQLTINWDKVRKAEKVKYHLGKTKLRHLVKVHFINEKGEPDSAAWYVRNVELWIEAINGRAQAPSL